MLFAGTLRSFLRRSASKNSRDDLTVDIEIHSIGVARDPQLHMAKFICLSFGELV